MAQRSPLARDDPDGALQDFVRRARHARGRLGVYVALGASLGAIPLPWVPDSLVRRIRGALVHELATRRGLSLNPDARDVLAEPSGAGIPRGLASQALRFFGLKLALRGLSRFGPVGLVWPLHTALRTYALGHLFERYVELARTERAVRIDVDEARRVRAAIDGALVRAVTVGPPPTEDPTFIDDQRDVMTSLVDGLLGIAAGVPGKLLLRLETAFDELLARTDG
jgi:hypothetical protein